MKYLDWVGFRLDHINILHDSMC